MGMFTKRQYLTGENGWAEVGDTFYLHRAKLDGVVVIDGQERKRVKLEVSDTLEGDRVIVYSSGGGITRQIEDMDGADRAALPLEVRLDELPPAKEGNNPTRVLTPADQEPAAQAAAAAAGAGAGDNDW